MEDMYMEKKSITLQQMIRIKMKMRIKIQKKLEMYLVVRMESEEDPI